MKSLLPVLVIAALLLVFYLFAQRNRQRTAAAEASRKESIRPGSAVMTTSGLYGTVVVLNDDDTVQLSIAPGLEVKWALAALRDVQELPDRYRQGIGPAGSDPRDSRADLDKHDNDPDDWPDRPPA